MVVRYEVVVGLCRYIIQLMLCVVRLCRIPASEMVVPLPLVWMLLFCISPLKLRICMRLFMCRYHLGLPRLFGESRSPNSGLTALVAMAEMNTKFISLGIVRLPNMKVAAALHSRVSKAGKSGPVQYGRGGRQNHPISGSQPIHPRLRSGRCLKEVSMHTRKNKRH